MNIVFCNFDFENWRLDLACKLAAEFNRRGHNCFYYSYKRELATVFSKIDTTMTLVQFLKYQKNEMPLQEYQHFTDKELEDIVNYNQNLNITKNRPPKANVELRKKVKVFLEKLKCHHVTHNPDIYIVWGGNRYHEKAIVTFAKKYHSRAYFFEFGYFRPFTLTIEESGLNDYNSVPRDPEFFRNLYPDVKEDFDSLLKPSTAVLNGNESLSKILGHPPTRVMNRGKLARKFQKRKSINLNKRYVFVPFQVESDTQIIEHSPHIKSMANLVAITAEAVFDYNLKYNDELKVVFKPHPVDVDVKIEYIADLLKYYPHTEIAYTETTQNLLGNATLVITINSTVGIEALTQKKSVITLGNAFYAIPGLANVCKNYDQLPDMIKFTMDTEIDESLVFKYLKYLREEYFHEIYYEGADADSIESLAERLLRRPAN